MERCSRRWRAFALASFAAASAGAQESPFGLPHFKAGMSSAGLLLGVAQPTRSNGFDRFAGPGPEVGLQWMRYLWDWIGVGAEFDFFLLGKKRSTVPDAPFVEVTSQAAGFSLTGLGRVNLLRERSWTPFVIGGFGVHRVGLRATAVSNDPAGQVCFRGTQTCAESLSIASVVTGPTVTAGAGVEAMLFRGFSLAAEARWRQYFEKSLKGDAIDTLSYHLGTRFHFGL